MFIRRRFCGSTGTCTSFRFDCSFHTWLYRIVTNICLDHLRKRKVRKEESAVVETPRAARPHGQFEEEGAARRPERQMWNRQLKAAHRDGLRT